LGNVYGKGLGEERVGLGKPTMETKMVPKKKEGQKRVRGQGEAGRRQMALVRRILRAKGLREPRVLRSP
jgi:hypothetical protein